MGIETRVILIAPDSEVTPEQVKSKILSLISEDVSSSGMEIRVKETCFGALVEGEEKKVREIVEEVRKLDKNGIFSKPRGFPIGDPRICRATRRGGPRPGFHQLEFEYELLPEVRAALDKIEKERGKEIGG
ncbi:MAG: methanogenesis marker 6 protein [Methanophagales archaeon]|nr:methanogenesis marker 6 protein [Methanophagales archaeon]MCW3141099.1 methanogenesis marker 6 protein [Methanophagales archaeon]